MTFPFSFVKPQLTRAHLPDRPGRVTFTGTGVELPAAPDNFHRKLSRESVKTGENRND